MRKVILYIAPSLDGYIARENGSVDWLDKFRSAGADEDYTRFTAGIDTVLMGKKTYEQVLGFGVPWPYEGMKSYVFSREPVRGSHATGIADPVPFVASLKKENGRDIWLLGGSQAIALLLNAGLVDELILSIIPVILGGGIPLFNHIRNGVACTLTGSRPYPSGILEARYALSYPARQAAGG